MEIAVQLLAIVARQPKLSMLSCDMIGTKMASTPAPTMTSAKAMPLAASKRWATHSIHKLDLESTPASATHTHPISHCVRLCDSRTKLAKARKKSGKRACDPVDG